MWNFLGRANLTMWTADVYDPSKKVFPDRPAFNALVAVHDTLKPTPLFRVGSWLHPVHRGVRLSLGGGATRLPGPSLSALADRPPSMC